MMQRKLLHSQTYANTDLDAIMCALECADPTLASAYNVLRIALGIKPDKPKDVWNVEESALWMVKNERL